MSSPDPDAGDSPPAASNSTTTAPNGVDAAPGNTPDDAGNTVTPACDSADPCGCEAACALCPEGLFEDPSGDCLPQLSGLLVSSGSLGPSFDPTEESYTVQLSLFTTSVVISPTAAGGASVVVDGDTIAAGGSWTSGTLALGENAVTVEVHGADDTVRVYQLTLLRGEPTAYLKASTIRASHYFGGAVALSFDGNTLAVGAYGDKSDATGVNGDDTAGGAGYSGAVFIFNRTDGSWVQAAYIKASNTESSDYFGGRLALSADGSTLAVGAEEGSAATGVGGSQTSNAAPSSGATYVFARSGNSWSQQAYIKASNTEAGDYFGGALALSENGSTLAVGAWGEDGNGTGVTGSQSNNGSLESGAVYVFTRSSSSWSQQAYIKASNTGPNDWFGGAVALSADGSTLAVGASQEDSNATTVGGTQANEQASNSGAVYLFQRSGNAWSQQAYLKASNSWNNILFGESLSMSTDGNTLAVGASSEDSVVSESGAAYVFTRSGNTWAEQALFKAPNPDEVDYFGIAVGLSGDGNRLAIGASHDDSSATGVNGNYSNNSTLDSGAVYLFARTGTSWTQEYYLKASNTGGGDWFGAAVALSGDGATVAAGARAEASATGDLNDNSANYCGAAYVFR